MTEKIIPREVLFAEITRLIAEGHTVSITVKGHSMNPFLAHQRDQATLAPFTPSELCPGMVVLARTTDDRVVLHRIVKASAGRLVLSGDGNYRQYEETTPALVIARMTHAIRKERTYGCDGMVWKVYSALWQRTGWMRRWLLGGYRRIRGGVPRRGEVVGTPTCL